MHTASKECLYGLYVANIVKAMWIADTESSAYYTYSPYVSFVLYESLHLIGASSWPLFALLHHFTSLRRHGFRLDFSTRELGGLAFRDEGLWLQQQPLETHAALLDGFLHWRSHFVTVVLALQAALRNSDPDFRVVFVTMVYGHFNRFISGWSDRLKALGVGNLVMAALDADAYSLCIRHHGRQCVTGDISVFNKYTILLIAVQLGIDVMWLDFDIFLIQNPMPVLKIAAAEGHDILMGYDYLSDCVCNGFFYLRARPEVHRWLFDLVRWLYTHPYEHDQRAISALLNYTERIALDPEALPNPPKWTALDADRAFINWGPWAGGLKDLVLVHFVDGSAFSLYGRPTTDPSIPDHKRQSETAPVQPMEVFYMTPGAASAPNPEALWHTAPELKQMLEANMQAPPERRQGCGILPSVRSAHSGYGFLTDNGVRPLPPTVDEAAFV